MKEEYRNIQIQKYLDGSSSAGERAELEAWLAASEANRQQFEQVAAIIEQLGQLDLTIDPKTDQDWERLKARLQTETDKQGTTQVVPLRRRNWLKIAASLLVLIATGWLIANYLFKESPSTVAAVYQTGEEERKTVRLTDGTTARLNTSSRLQVSAGFDGSEREVSLSGEAWFEVAKNEARPFVIESKGVYTRVLGTAFNLRAYPGEKTVELSVAEGKVQFYEDEKPGIILEAQQAGTYDRSSGTIQPSEYQPLLANAWHSNTLQFDNTPFKDVLRVLEKRYDLTIEDQTAGFDERLTAQFDDSTRIEEILQQLELLYDLEIEINQREVLIRK